MGHNTAQKISSNNGKIQQKLATYDGEYEDNPLNKSAMVAKKLKDLSPILRERTS